MFNSQVNITVEFRGSYHFLSGIKGSDLWSNRIGVLSNEETQFLKEMFKIPIVMHENNFHSWAIYRRGPFSVNLCQLWYFEDLLQEFFWSFSWILIFFSLRTFYFTFFLLNQFEKFQIVLKEIFACIKTYRNKILLKH